ncbi:alcohol oxidase [Dendrothele bispora CBS 962.96]|uniref:Alcohol oxidase n=1 Tax=Dendrothele bispora (strain CBS 962.96) TaxID=1314807 RepID=A0A4S8L247_DENBC|nr:alcohol oxidase [Dendrothele bispora CBS 962.96]
MSASATDTFDLIFAGGGTTACICAGRLAAADPSLRILLLEAGPHTRNLQTHIQPARYFRNLAVNETLTYQIGNPSKALNGRAPIVPTGRCVGGGSAVNFQMYTRASPSDYDDWEKFGNPGWSSKDLIPLANKAENYQVNDSPKHGHSGPLKISVGGLPTNIDADYLKVASAYDKDRSLLDDVADFGEINGYGDSTNENLVVKDRCCVVRVIFEGNRAIGVEYVDDASNRNNSDKDQKDQKDIQISRAMAEKCVIVSGGAFGSPAILERSGIGSKNHLQELDVPVLVDLPGVGENYQDHNLVFTGFYAHENAHTMDDIFRGTDDVVKPHLDQWLQSGTGLMAHNGIDVGIKLRPIAKKEFVELGEEFKKTWEGVYANTPDKPVAWSGVINAYAGADTNDYKAGKRYISGVYYLCYPVSIGHVHIRDGQNPYMPLEFETGYLDEPADLASLRWTYKHSRELIRRMAHYRGETPSGHPKFPEGSAAAARGECDGPEPIEAEDIVYTEEDDRAIDNFHRDVVNTAWHSLGTCAMKPREQNGVVDSSLNVYGVQNLKVADMSIAPKNVGANTYNTAIVIGERAALILAGELGIKGV